MRSRVLPLDTSARDGTSAGATERVRAATSGRRTGGGAAAARPSGVKGSKSKARTTDRSQGPPIHKKPKQRSKKSKKKQQLAVVGLAAGISALVLILSLLATFPTAHWSESASEASDAATLGDMEPVSHFMRWFQAAGGRVEGVDISEFPGMGRGVVARRNIRQDDAMLFVPKEIIMCADTIFASSTPSEVLDKLETLRNQEDELLTAFLLLEQLKGERSHWFPYLRLLPSMPLSIAKPWNDLEDTENLSSPLLYASDSHVEQLQDAYMSKMAREERSRAKQGFRRFKRLFSEWIVSLSSDRQVTSEQYVWSRFLINSRAFSIHGRRFLVPFGDLFNGQSQQQARAHDNGRHFLKYHALEDAGMVIRADRDTAAAQQVLEDYGDNDNYIYFLYHGFLMPDNAFDCTMVQLPSIHSTATEDDGDNDVLQMKIRVLRHFGVANGPMVCVSPDGSVREGPLARFYSALHHASDDRMRTECEGVEQYAQCFLTPDASTSTQHLERGTSAVVRMTRLVSDAIINQLAAFPTTLSQDEQLIREHELRQQSADDGSQIAATLNVHAVRFRASRKRILKTAMVRLSQQIADMSEERDKTTLSAATEDNSEHSKAIDAADGYDSSATAPNATDEVMGEAEVPNEMPPSLSRDRFERFQQWIHELKLPINHLELRYIDDTVGYGTFAAKALSEGEVYLRVPVSLAMNVQSALQSPSSWLLEVSRAAGGGQSADVLLTLHLLDEKFGPRSPESHWKPYLDMLPSIEAGRMSSPLFYAAGGAEMQLLAQTDLLLLVERYRQRVTSTFASVMAAVETLADAESAPLRAWLTSERFQWASAVLDSRSIWWGGQRHLVPLLDMVNCLELSAAHKAHETRVTGAGGRFADTRASWAFAAGDHVVENYGQPNYIYLLYHGFVLARNSHDCAHLRIDAAAGLEESAGDRGAVGGSRRLVAARLERLGVFAWQWDACVSADDTADVERFARIALVAVHPARALGKATNAPVGHEEAIPARQLVQQRLDKLAAAASVNDSAGCAHCRVVSLYAQQQRELLLRLREQLDVIE